MSRAGPNAATPRSRSNASGRLDRVDPDETNARTSISSPCWRAIFAQWCASFPKPSLSMITRSQGVASGSVGPEGVDAHEEVAVAEHRNGQPPHVQAEGGTDE